MNISRPEMMPELATATKLNKDGNMEILFDASSIKLTVDSFYIRLDLKG